MLNGKHTSGRTIRDEFVSNAEVDRDEERHQSEPGFNQDPLGLLRHVTNKYKLLSRAQSIELARRAREENDMEARDKLVLHNIRLALWMVRRYPSMELELLDRVQEAIIGIITAVDKFDPSQGFSFSTYAQWWIRQALTRHWQDHKSMIREPVHLQELRSKVQRASVELASELKRIPTPQEIAARLNIEEKKVIQSLKKLRIPIVSLDQEVTGSSKMEGSKTIGDNVPDVGKLDALQLMEAKEEMRAACGELDTLVETLYDSDATDRNKNIFAYYYGLDGQLQGRTLEVVGERFDVTRERVRQIVARTWDEMDRSGLDMDHDRLVRTIERIRLLETLTNEEVAME